MKAHWVVQRDSTLIDFLQEKTQGVSRTKIRKWLVDRRVWVDNQCITRADYPLLKEMIVQLAVGEKKTLIQAAIPVLYEDAHLLVVNKPHGLLTNSPHPNDTTVQSLLNEYIERTRQRYHAHTIHRLDRETSGLLLFAKDKKTALLFEDHWKERVFDRRYIAVTHGIPPHNEGTVSSWLKENRMFVTYSAPYNNGGKLAVTHYRLLQQGTAFALLELQLETGRKNQIRVHLQDLGIPVAGDRKYGDGSNPIGRLCLHAYKLCFYHPITGKELRFETEIPAAFKAVIRQDH